MTSTDINTLVKGILEGDKASLARAISLVEDRRGGFRDLLKAIYPESGSSHIIGITGSPGSGKSTLVNSLIGEFRKQSDQIGVIGVDPSSPYSGGSILGDRVRFESSRAGDDVFFRSMSARGIQGGLAAATGDVIRLMDAAGCDPILVETVGAGQNEVDIVRTADTVLVVMMPSSGDDVQMLKAGILEIGDLFVVNKADIEGADRTAMDLEQMIRRSQDQTGDNTGTEAWEPVVLKTVATRGENVDDVHEAILEHRQALEASNRLRQRRIERCEDEITRLIQSELKDIADRQLANHGGLQQLAEDVNAGRSDPYSLVERIVSEINPGESGPEQT
ncbi:MAG: methylmalonyl Co-A mutase-associated GTPase MeaB [bacterium]